MQTPESMAREFHAALHVHAGWMPATPTTIIPPYLHELRQALLDEEVDELREAVAAADVVKIADALADITYVVGGTAVTYGIPLDAVLAEVHKSNMTKTNTPDEAKLVKGPGYEPPHIAEVLGLQMSDRFESRDDLAAKIEWEGGILEALDYGIKIADMPEGDTELIEAWTKLQRSFETTRALVDALNELLPEAGC